MILLLHHWFGIPAAIASPVLDLICYFAAFRLLGKDFLKTSALASVCLAGWFFLWERLPYFLPDLSGHPLAAAVAGAAFIGLGVGLVVRRGYIKSVRMPDRGGVSFYRPDSAFAVS